MKSFAEWLIFKIKIIYGWSVFEGDSPDEASAIRQEWQDLVIKIGKKGVLATILNCTLYALYFGESSKFNLTHPFIYMVGVTRIELATPASRRQCSTKLSYTPNLYCLLLKKSSFLTEVQERLYPLSIFYDR